MKTPLPNSIMALAPVLTEWRRDFHQHPELGYEETRTAGVVAQKLRSFGFDHVEEGVGRTGVVGVLYGAKGPAASPEKAIMLRADMDALPMTEETGAAYASQTPGKMHACGHDGHTTMLLGAAKLLAETRPFDGSVYFCFQPAEEGGAGAREMIRDGLFERYDCARVFGMHNWPNVPVGVFAVRPGPVLAASDEFRIILRGRGAHAAKPDRSRDPVIAAAHLITTLQTLVSRSTNPLSAAVVSVTQVNAGTAFNVIPDTAEISGTVRCFEDDVYDMIHAGIDRQAAAIAAAFDMEAEIVRPDTAYPPTVNDEDAALFARDVLDELVGADFVMRDFPPTMGGEDFAFLARERPGAFVFCGNGESAPLHNVKFDFNDEASPFGVAYWRLLVERSLPL